MIRKFYEVMEQSSGALSDLHHILLQEAKETTVYAMFLCRGHIISSAYKIVSVEVPYTEHVLHTSIVKYITMFFPPCL